MCFARGQVNINARDDAGRDALQLASECGHAKVERMLVEHKAGHCFLVSGLARAVFFSSVFTLERFSLKHVNFATKQKNAKQAKRVLRFSLGLVFVCFLHFGFGAADPERSAPLQESSVLDVR